MRTDKPITKLKTSVIRDDGTLVLDGDAVCYTNVLRAGVGVFNDRSGPVVVADVLHSQPAGLTQDRDHRSRLSRSVRIGGRHRAAAEHRATRARCEDPAKCSIQRELRPPAQKDDDRVGELYRRARLQPVSIA